MIRGLRKAKVLFSILSVIVALAIFASGIFFYLLEKTPFSYAEIVNLSFSQSSLPVGNFKVSLETQHLPVLRAVEFDAKNPLNFNLFFDKMGYSALLEKDTNRLVKYFLGFLTTPTQDLWVNLSPYEKEKMIPESLAKLDIGKDLLLEDYLLKQLTSFMTNPKTAQGKRYWQRVNQAALDIAGTTNVPIETACKVWIVPDVAKVSELIEKEAADNTKISKIRVFVTQAKLKVLMEEDYFAVKQNNQSRANSSSQVKNILKQVNQEAQRIFKEEILGQIEQQVNTSLAFAPLRQLYYSLILAAYFKEKLQSHPLYQAYIAKEKSSPIAITNSAQVKEKVFDAYLKSVEQGVYNTVDDTNFRKNERKQRIRKYFSGGMHFNSVPKLNVSGLKSLKEWMSSLADSLVEKRALALQAVNSQGQAVSFGSLGGGSRRYKVDNSGDKDDTFIVSKPTRGKRFTVKDIRTGAERQLDDLSGRKLNEFEKMIYLRNMAELVRKSNLDDKASTILAQMLYTLSHSMPTIILSNSVASGFCAIGKDEKGDDVWIMHRNLFQLSSDLSKVAEITFFKDDSQMGDYWKNPNINKETEGAIQIEWGDNQTKWARFESNVIWETLDINNLLSSPQTLLPALVAYASEKEKDIARKMRRYLGEAQDDNLAYAFITKAFSVDKNISRTAEMQIKQVKTQPVSLEENFMKAGEFIWQYLQKAFLAKSKGDWAVFGVVLTVGYLFGGFTGVMIVGVIKISVFLYRFTGKTEIFKNIKFATRDIRHNALDIVSRNKEFIDQAGEQGEKNRTFKYQLKADSKKTKVSFLFCVSKEVNASGKKQFVPHKRVIIEAETLERYSEQQSRYKQVAESLGVIFASTYDRQDQAAIYVMGIPKKLSIDSEMDAEKVEKLKKTMRKIRYHGASWLAGYIKRELRLQVNANKEEIAKVYNRFSENLVSTLTAEAYGVISELIAGGVLGELVVQPVVEKLVARYAKEFVSGNGKVDLKNFRKNVKNVIYQEKDNIINKLNQLSQLRQKSPKLGKGIADFLINDALQQANNESLEGEAAFSRLDFVLSLAQDETLNLEEKQQVIDSVSGKLTQEEQTFFALFTNDLQSAQKASKKLVELYIKKLNRAENASLDYEVMIDSSSDTREETVGSYGSFYFMKCLKMPPLPSFLRPGGIDLGLEKDSLLQEDSRFTFAGMEKFTLTKDLIQEFNGFAYALEK